MLKPNYKGNRSVRLWLLPFFIWAAALSNSYGASGIKSIQYPDTAILKIKEKADKMLAITRPGYYTAFFVPNRNGMTLSNARVSNIQACTASLCSSTPLPITLVEFIGKRLDAKQIQLDWTTTSEVNNDYFEIERTLNPAVGFVSAGSVKGQGNTASNISYQFTDLNKETTYTYYRLKQVDLDGSFAYSRIIAIKGYNQELVVNAFPNPGSGKELAFLVSGGNLQESISVRIFDQKGRSVYQNANYILPENQQIALPGVATQAGSYYIKIRTKQQEASSTFIILK